MPAFSLLAKPARLEEAKTPPPPAATPTSDSPSSPRQEKVNSAEHSHRRVSKSKKASRHAHQPKPLRVSTHPAKQPLPTPPSTASSTTPPERATSRVSPLIALSVLEEIITAEVTYWAHYISTISATTNFATLTTDSTSTGTVIPAELKAEALRHILETLPLRFKALALAYPDSDTGSDPDLKPGLLTPSLQVLLDTLQNPDQQGELEGWYDQKLFQSRKFRPDVLNLEDEIRRLEEARMEELKGLLVMVEEMKLAAAEGLVGDDALKVLIEAMDEAGLSAAGLPDSSTSVG